MDYQVADTVGTILLESYAVVRPIQKGNRVKGGHPFKGGSQHRRGKLRTAKVRAMARGTIRKAISTRFGSRGGRRRSRV